MLMANAKSQKKTAGVTTKKSQAKPKCKKCRRLQKNCNCEKAEKRGRKQFDGKDEKVVVAKLETAYSLDCTDEEACLQAEISLSALYEYQKANPQFLERKRLLKNKLILGARNTVAIVMQERNADNKPTDRALDTSFKYLERKRKHEFAPHSTAIVDDGREGALTEERKQEIAGALANWNKQYDDSDDYTVKV